MKNADFEKRYITARRQVIGFDFRRLNAMQREAVMATEGPLLILAGAGSGKTTVLINRIANLLRYGRGSDCDFVPATATEEDLALLERAAAMAESGGTVDEELFDAARRLAAVEPVEPWRIIAITFTNKAADEMKSRLASMLGDEANDIWARTFHSACVRILRRDADRLGYPRDFTIYDTSDSLAIMKRVVRELDLDDKTFNARAMLSAISSARDRCQSPEDFADECRKSGDYRQRKTGDIYKAYARRLFEAGAMDFDDLLYNTVRLMKENDDVREHYQRLFKYVLIDEYQDTNMLQYQFSALLAGGRGNICVVGDDDQSIYAFRGATIENILSFEARYPGCRTIRLEQNYRSTGHILDAANAVIGNNRGRKGKTLWTQADPGEPIALHQSMNEDDEARFVVSEVMKAVKNGGRLADNAVLYRMNAQSRALEQAFLRNGIRPRIIKGNPFFERAEIKDLMAYFFVVMNPLDELRLLRIINVPARGIGATTVENARTIAARDGKSLFDVVSAAGEYPELKRAAEKLADFAKMINTLRADAAQRPLDALYERVIALTGYERMLSEKRTEENQNKLENIRELKSFISSYMKEAGEEASLDGFMDQVSLYTDLSELGAEEDSVVLMTIHSAKGLEFPTVFLVGAEEGLFPGLQSIGDEAAIEEERRLCYVAMTRARKRLFVTYARQRMIFGQTAAHRVSRFVEEIPNEHLDAPAVKRPPFLAFGGPDGEREGWETPAPRYAAPSSPREAPRRSHVAPPAPAPERAPAPSFAVGDRVNHTAFGRGVIKEMQPVGGDFLTVIDFGPGGKKKLMLKFAARYITKE